MECAIETVAEYGYAQASLVRIAERGHATAAAVPGARLVTYRGMAHDLPRQLWPAVIDEISALAGKSGAPIRASPPRRE